MAPETLRGCLPSQASDVWSFGCMLIELATGQPPWQGLLCDDLPVNMLLYKLSSITAPPRVPRGPHVPSEFVSFVEDCVQLDPCKRATAADLERHKFLVEAPFLAPRPSSLAPDDSERASAASRSVPSSPLIPPSAHHSSAQLDTLSHRAY